MEGEWHIPPKQPHNRLAHHDTGLWNPFLRRVTRVLGHFEEGTLREVDGAAFATLFLKVALDGVDVVWEGGCREDGD